MIYPLILGGKSFANNIIQGPLAGVSCAPFRLLTWRYSEPAFTCTEMISCKTLLHQSKELQKRFVYKDPAEGPVCFQLSANNPLELAQAVRLVSDQGADLIDLNCGCPVKKIRSKGAGSSLLMDSRKLYQLIRAMKDNTSVPVSVKIRVEGKSTDKFNAEIAQVVADAGADFLVVHGRHWTEHYETPCNHEQIQFFVENLKIPVIGNGDIADLESLQKMFATGCSGVMIGRAGVGQPWLIRQLIHEMQGKEFSLPNWPEKKSLFIEHITRLSELLGNEKFSLLQGRKFAKYYARGLANRAEFCEAVNQCENLKALSTLLDIYFN
ncbi:MAG TPA: tRNA-dihydrouridine synthase [Coxiellaceae bacterium]|nr:tRNA-dihydrouridine synthase [Coxiellaceae bacterium]